VSLPKRKLKKEATRSEEWQKAERLRRREAKRKRQRRAMEDFERQPEPWVRVSQNAMLRSRIRRSQDIVNPFIMQRVPPGVLPRGKTPERIAMDNGNEIQVNAWAAQQVYNGAFFNGIGFMGYTLLSEMAQRPEYRRISEVLAVEMTRKWIKLRTTSTDESTQKAKAESIKQLDDELNRLDVRGAFRASAEGDGFFGRMHIYLDTGDTDERRELLTSIGDGSERDPNSDAKLEKGCLKAVKPVEPVWTYPAKYNAYDPLKPDWYNPTTWFVQGKELHATRLLTFVGRHVPDMLKPVYQFGGLSLTQMAKPYVDNWLRTRQAVADLIWTFSVMVLKTNMEGIEQQGGSAFYDRLEMFANLRTNQGVMAIDKSEEELENVSAPLGGLHELQSQAQEQMCSITGTPVVKLLGVQPAGMNASSEGELTTWYDWVAAFQEKLFRRHLTTVINVTMRSLWGKVDPDITFDFEPLEEMTEKEQAEVDKQKMDTDVAGVGAGILDPTEARARIAADPRQPYGEIDSADVPEAPGMEDAMGGIGEGDLDEEGQQPEGAGEGQEKPGGKLGSLLGQLSNREPGVREGRGERDREPAERDDRTRSREGRDGRQRSRGSRQRAGRSWEKVDA